MITKQSHSYMYCLIVISAGSLSLLKQLLAQMFSTLARPSNCSLVKEHPPSTLCPISSRVYLDQCPPWSEFLVEFENHSLCTMHIWGKKLYVWHSRVEIKHYSVEPVPCRNLTLFRCIFQPHYCVRNAVVQNFFKGGANMCSVSAWMSDKFM